MWSVSVVHKKGGQIKRERSMFSLRHEDQCAMPLLRPLVNDSAAGKSAALHFAMDAADLIGGTVSGVALEAAWPRAQTFTQQSN